MLKTRRFTTKNVSFRPIIYIICEISSFNVETTHIYEARIWKLTNLTRTTNNGIHTGMESNKPPIFTFRHISPH